MNDAQTEAVLYAGNPGHDPLVYLAMRFLVHDPSVHITLANGERLLIVRNIEVDRARSHAAADEVLTPEDVVAEAERSGDRETLFAQAAAAALGSRGVRKVRVHRNTPALVVQHLSDAGIEVVCDASLGVRARRSKSDSEIEALRAVQKITEDAIEFACRRIARAEVADDGTLTEEGVILTSERVRTAINMYLLEHECEPGSWIVAGGAHASDPHERGSGPLCTGQTIIIDVFPRHIPSRYHGDCTRVVVHGEVPEKVARMHAAVVAAKAAAIDACVLGASGDSVHAVTAGVLARHGYKAGGDVDTAAGPAMPHGTGHGLGLEVHEPPLLDANGPELVKGDALTVEPGLYHKGYAGVRIEDLVIVTDGEPLNLNSLPETLDWL